MISQSYPLTQLESIAYSNTASQTTQTNHNYCGCHFDHFRTTLRYPHPTYRICKIGSKHLLSKVQSFPGLVKKEIILVGLGLNRRKPFDPAEYDSGKCTVRKFVVSG